MSNLEIVTDAGRRHEVRRAAEPVRRLRHPARRRVRRPARRRGHRREDRRRTPAPRTATSPASSPRPRPARACRRASARRSSPGSPTSPSRPTVVEVVRDLDLAEPDTRLRPLDDTAKSGCRSPRRAVGAGRRDDEDHRRARRRRRPLIQQPRRRAPRLPGEYRRLFRGRRCRLPGRPSSDAAGRANESRPSASGCCGVPRRIEHGIPPRAPHGRLGPASARWFC